MADERELSTDPRWSDIAEALLASASSQPPRVVVADAVETRDRFSVPSATPMAERDIVKSLRGGHPPTVVALATVSPTVLRALREAPPRLLVLLGETDERTLGSLREQASMAVLGPRATLRVEPDGSIIGVAHATDELEGLERTLGPLGLAIAMAPCPSWLPHLLESEGLSTCPVAGYVAAGELRPAWVHWSRRTSVRHVLVPVGVVEPPLDAPGDPRLTPAAVAHALEARTGPVFPAPRVVALVLEGLGREGVGEDAQKQRETAEASSPEQLAVWAQARRALPLTGALVGMEQPDPRLDLRAPNAAFLAQRALLRVRATSELLTRSFEPPPPPDPDGVARAEEVLRSAGEILTDHESKVVLRGFGLEVTRQAVASSASGASGFAERIGYPVVLKALSPDLRRRSDVGGVELDLTTAAAVRRAYAAIVDSVERRAPTARLDGVLVAEMVEPGLDLRCGGLRLTSGEVALYGRVEGVSVPVESALALAPLRPDDALLLAHAVVTRAPVPALRRESDPDIELLAELFLRLSAVFDETADRIDGIDLGPVRLVGPPRGYVTLDARILQRPHLEGL